MAVNVVLNGVSYSIPEPGDTAWGQGLTDYFVAQASGLLQKAGGSFSLTAEVDFGATFGLKSAYFKSRGTNPAAAGVLRLANLESISWRNAANGADLALKVNASDLLEYNGTAIQPAGSYITALTGDITASGPGSVAASLVATSNATLTALSALTSAAALATVGTITTGVWSATAIAYAKLALTGSIVNADIAAAAAIAYSKLAALTASRVMVTDGSGFGSASSVTATTLAFLDATSSIQTQLDAKTLKSTLTTKGDLYAATAASTPARLAAGADGTVLTADSAQATGLKWTTPLTNPMTTGGDLIYGGASGAATRLANGSSGQVLTSAGGTSAPAWQTLVGFQSGMLADHAGGTAPTGFLLCDGSAVSRSTYADLFTAIGTLWGAGDGSTTFNVPDLRGRVTAGKDNMGGSAANRLTSGGSGVDGSTVGAVGGAQTVTLSSAEMPSHTHALNRGTGTGSVHKVNGSLSGASSGTVSFSFDDADSLTSTGGGGAHNNVQPAGVVLKIIKT